MKKADFKPNKMPYKPFVRLFAVWFLHQSLSGSLSAQTHQHTSGRRFPDSALAIASLQYSQPSLLQKLLMGENYREEWATPVKLPVLDIKAKGFRIKELGGGKQTKSLKFLDQHGAEWALRSVDKDVTPALPKLIRNKLTVSVVQDMVSAANPYAPLTVPPLAEALGIRSAPPTFYFVPDDTAFGQYREIFANTVCLLEKRDLLPGVETSGTENMLKDIMDNHKAVIDQEAFLKARLLDMLIADWDRHYDQWKWAPVNAKGVTHYEALPKDRDQTYFYSQGWLLKFIRLFGMDFSVGLSESTSNLVKLNSVARTLDELLLNGLEREEWKRIAEQFQQQLSDDLIRSAVKKMPPQIYALHGSAIMEKLLKRKRTLPVDVMTYYRSLAKKVTVYGTDKAEHFYLSGNRDSVVLTVSDQDKTTPFYQRTFHASETKKVTLLGLDGDDVFTCEKGLQTPIDFKIDGGKGKNQYNLDRTFNGKIKESAMDAKAYLKKLRKPLRIRD